METLGTIIAYASAIAVVISSIWFLIVAFKHSLLWGLLCFFIPPLSIVFALLNWDIAGGPVKYQILSWIGVFIGVAIMG